MNVSQVTTHHPTEVKDYFSQPEIKIVENLFTVEHHSNNDTNVKYFVSEKAWPMITGCPSFFGNGFSKEIIECETDISKFFCKQNPSSNAMFCEAHNLIIDPNFIQVSIGGETISAVRNRREDNEFPKYKLQKITILK